eukprot:2324088-Pyramimonas_sp.AAC.1
MPEPQSFGAQRGPHRPNQPGAAPRAGRRVPRPSLGRAARPGTLRRSEKALESRYSTGARSSLDGILLELNPAQMESYSRFRNKGRG